MNSITNRNRPQPQRVAPTQQRAQQPAQVRRAQQPATPQSLVQRGVSFFERNAGTALGVGLRTNGLIAEARTIYGQRGGGILRPRPENRTQVSRFRNAGTPQNAPRARAMRALRVGGPVLGAALNAVRLPGQFSTAARDIRQGFRTGDFTAAERSSRTALNTASTAAQGLSASRGVTLGSQSQTVRRTFDTARRFVSRSAGPVSTAVRGMATRLASSTTARVATRLATSTALQTTGRIAARTAGRFVPGANVAIAALDINEARRAFQDPNAGVGRRTTAVITALGSVAAASNIPVVSQVGAVVSTLSSAIGAFFS